MKQEIETRNCRPNLKPNPNFRLFGEKLESPNASLSYDALGWEMKDSPADTSWNEPSSAESYAVEDDKVGIMLKGSAYGVHNGGERGEEGEETYVTDGEAEEYFAYHQTDEVTHSDPNKWTHTYHHTEEVKKEVSNHKGRGGGSVGDDDVRTSSQEIGDVRTSSLEIGDVSKRHMEWVRTGECPLTPAATLRDEIITEVNLES